ncbi:MAG: hypothetical protein KAU21_08230, partial [Gammaproteobacteria bacterium]|nr:hypothetical protein [Gammaproteobacteria bacterium]
PIAIDHQSWLGDSREEIAAEKAGIIKSTSQVVYNDPEPCQVVIDQAKKLNVQLYCSGRDFHYQPGINQWQFTSSTETYNELSELNLSGEFQCQNAAAVIQVSQLLNQYLPLDADVLKKALVDIKCQGRFQQLGTKPDIYIDVAHNAHAVAALSENLQHHECQGRTLAVMAMLEDKAICEALGQIDGNIDHYYLAGLQGSRALSAEEMKQRIQDCVSDDKLSLNNTVELAIEKAIAAAGDKDRIIIFGSFLTVSAAISMLTKSNSGIGS